VIDVPQLGPSVSTSSAAATTHPHHPVADPRGKELRLLALGALGVVYGDIGTSPR
jgi:K+ transporter